MSQYAFDLRTRAPPVPVCAGLLEEVTGLAAAVVDVETPGAVALLLCPAGPVSDREAGVADAVDATGVFAGSFSNAMVADRPRFAWKAPHAPEAILPATCPLSGSKVPSIPTIE